MLFEIKEKHHRPHIHAFYQGYKASIAVEDGVLLEYHLLAVARPHFPRISQSSVAMIQRRACSAAATAAWASRITR